MGNWCRSCFRSGGCDTDTPNWAQYGWWFSVWSAVVPLLKRNGIVIPQKDRRSAWIEWSSEHSSCILTVKILRTNCRKEEVSVLLSKRFKCHSEETAIRFENILRGLRALKKADETTCAAYQFWVAFLKIQKLLVYKHSDHHSSMFSKKTTLVQSLSCTKIRDTIDLIHDDFDEARYNNIMNTF